MPTQKQNRVLAAARLARLEIAAGLAPEEAAQTLERFAAQFDDIVKLMDALSSVDTNGVEPLHWPLPAKASAPREDIQAKHCTREELLANAPDQDGEFFIVPRIV